VGRVLRVNTDRFTGEYTEAPIITHCDRCKAAIYQGDAYIDTGEDICVWCADEEEKINGVKVVAGMGDGIFLDS